MVMALSIVLKNYRDVIIEQFKVEQTFKNKWNKYRIVTTPFVYAFAIPKYRGTPSFYHRLCNINCVQ